MTVTPVRNLWQNRKIPILILSLVLAAALWIFVLVRHAHTAGAQQHISAGVQAFQAGRGAEAEQEWRQAAVIDPGNADLWDLLSEYYIKSEQWNKGSDALAHLLRLDPKRPYIYSRMAACSLRSGDELAAQRLAQEELKRNPSDEASLTILAFLSQMQENPEQQIVYLRRLLEKTPNDPETLQTLTQTLYDVGKFQDIIPVADRLILAKPDESLGYALRAAARYETDATPQASALSEADLRKALELAPLSPFARFVLGKVYLRMGQYPKAIFQLETAQKLSPRKLEVPFELARAYSSNGQPDKAAQARQRFETLRAESTRISMLQKRCGLEPNNFQIRLDLARFFLEAQDDRKTYYYIRKALALKPEDTGANQIYRQLVSRLVKTHSTSANP